jgi:hypothetical protein
MHNNSILQIVARESRDNMSYIKARQLLIYALCLSKFMR